MQSLLNDESVSVRIEAAELLATLTDSPEALDLLATELESPNEWAACRAARALELLGDRASSQAESMQAAFNARVPKDPRKAKTEGINYGFEFSLRTALENLGQQP